MARRQVDDWESYVSAVGVAIMHLNRHAVNGPAEGPSLTGINIKLDADNRTSVLVVLKAVEGEEKLVGFVGGPDLPTAIIAAGKKVAADVVRWREDRPWEWRGE